MGTSICTKVEVQELPHHLKEGRFFTLVVTQVKDPENFWFMVYDECGGHFEAVQAAMDDMEQFYSGVEGDRWRVTSVKQCPPGTRIPCARPPGRGSSYEESHLLCVGQLCCGGCFEGSARLWVASTCRFCKLVGCGVVASG